LWRRFSSLPVLSILLPMKNLCSLLNNVTKYKYSSRVGRFCARNFALVSSLMYMLPIIRLIISSAYYLQIHKDLILSFAVAAVTRASAPASPI
jgi:hypothetical protein